MPRLSVLFALTGALVAARADLRLPALLANHMVVQRDSHTTFWGWADPGEAVTVTPSWPGAQPVTTTTGEKGEWAVKVATPPAGGPYTVTLQGENTRVLEDVLSGEVWVCSGQSNMEWGLAASENAQAEIAASAHPAIRLFAVPKKIALAPQADTTGKWVLCSPQTTPGFSAVGYYFGRDLHQALGVPVGLIGSNWGGTRAEAWTSRAELGADPRYAYAVQELEQILASSQAGDPDKLMAEWTRAHEPPDGFTGSAPNGSGWKQTDNLTLSGNGLGGHDGSAWFNTLVDVPEAAVAHPARLHFQSIDDMDEVYINGKRVGATLRPGRWNTPRNYLLPPHTFKTGYNSLCVRVFDTAADGGILGAPATRRVELGGGAAPVVLDGTWFFRKGVSFGTVPSLPVRQDPTANTPSALYNGMIAPLLPHAIRGVIWYQGESNVGNAWMYHHLFPHMIGAWRRAWGLGDFPFFFVQIAPYRYNAGGRSAELREAQRLTLAAAPNTGMAVIHDVGDVKDIHPRNKKDVGLRLARWARAQTYGEKDLVHSGPLFQSAAREGSALRVRFAHAGGLQARGGEPTCFTVAGADREFKPATARIEGDSVRVSHPEIPEPVAVRLGWSDTDEPNLFNGTGLPASPFRSDDWPLLTQPQP
jgi:sialate O-acetylesterase